MIDEEKRKLTKPMRSAKSVLRECFLGVIDFNEAAAIDAMKKYAKLYHESKVKKILPKLNHTTNSYEL